MNEKTYRTVHIEINTLMSNISSDLTDDDVIGIVHRQLNESFGLYIDRDQIRVKEGN